MEVERGKVVFAHEDTRPQARLHLLLLRAGILLEVVALVCVSFTVRVGSAAAHVGREGTGFAR